VTTVNVELLEGGPYGVIHMEAATEDDVLDEYEQLRQEGIDPEPSLEKRLKDRQQRLGEVAVSAPAEGRIVEPQ
jgi:hypothetical protein